MQITYDAAVISYRALLDIFFAVHDPTTLNRQGNDIGAQYRSAIFWHNRAQKETAEALIAELNAASLWPRPIVTQVVPLETFYPAEDYHQNYFANHPEQPYCRAVINPKVQKFRRKFAVWLK